jgi:starch synthase
MAEPLKVLFVAAEMAPLAKVGGLADVVGSLPRSLRELGVDARVVLPRYPRISGDLPQIAALPSPVDRGSELRILSTSAGGVPVFLVDDRLYFDRPEVYGYADDGSRFLAFCHAALQAMEALAWIPDVVHCHDWHTAIVPHWLRAGAHVPVALRGSASVLTIHNLAYQGWFDPAGPDGRWIVPEAFYSRPDGGHDLLTQGIASADLVTTVSESYAHEITTPECGEGLDGLLRDRMNSLRGILNGIDWVDFNPATDRALAASFSAEHPEGKAACKQALQREVGFDLSPRTPLIGVVGRLVEQKGVDLLAEVLPAVLAELDLQVVLLGTGEPAYEGRFREMSSRARRQLAAFLTFDEALARRIYAGADIFLMASRFEPCGLGQLISLRYGTVPVVHRTGGLADTVVDYQPSTHRGTGFLFRGYDPTALALALGRAIEVYRDSSAWSTIQRNGMLQDFSWTASAARYLDAYHDALALRAARQVG